MGGEDNWCIGSCGICHLCQWMRCNIEGVKDEV
jgi:hypothetical protein